LRGTWERAGTASNPSNSEYWLWLIRNVKSLLIVDYHVLQRSC
jgi:hypothetical protein